jgi:hypothetical protein
MQIKETVDALQQLKFSTSPEGFLVERIEFKSPSDLIPWIAKNRNLTIYQIPPGELCAGMSMFHIRDSAGKLTDGVAIFTLRPQ